MYPLHIVSFDVPFPPSYGGVIDVFYKITALKEAGAEIHLHCFRYGRAEAKELEKYCASVNYYERLTEKRLLFSNDPYIVVSRRSPQLLNDLLNDDFPVLFEGLHSCAWLDAPELKGREKLVRTHNIEHDYYRSLAAAERKFFKRRYFRSEANKLQKFEEKLSLASHVLAISPADAQTLSSRYQNVEAVTAFHPYSHVKVQPGRGNFALYHGNLEVGENNLAALFLVNEVFDDIPVPLVIAGNNPSPALREAVSGKKNISLRAGIPTGEIEKLIMDAQVNVLPTFQSTGIKLKLLAVLFRGRHCVVSPQMVIDTGLESLCTIAPTAPSMKARLLELFPVDFNPAEIEKREKILGERFSNKMNAEKIVSMITG